MTIKKFDLSKIKGDVFYKYIYPIYSKSFLFGDNYEDFAFLVSANFILSTGQWDEILKEWEFKESILKIETK
mgnify:CR=1 FL=1